MTTSGTGANLSVGNNNTDTTYAGVISGTNSASALTKIGAATLTLTGNSTYVGPTTISSGTLQIGNGTTDGSLAGGILNNAALVFNTAGSPSYGGAISGTGTLTKSGSGTLTLTAGNSFNGVTTINSGTLQFGDGTTGHDGTVAGAIVNNASLVFNLAGTGTYNGVISGAGNFTTTAGTVVFNATNTFTGPLAINAGSVQLGGGHSTLGSGSSAVTLANAASAAIYLNINNDGPINYSIGSLSGGGALGGNIVIQGGSTLTVGTDNTSTTYAGHIAQGSWANGNLTKVGTGTLTFAGTFDAWGNLAVNGGVLQVASPGYIYPTFGIATVSTGGTLKLNGGWGSGTGGFNGNFSTRPSNLVIDNGTIDMAGSYTSWGRSFTIGAGGATLKTEAGVTWALNNDIYWQYYGGNTMAPIVNNSSLTLDGSGAGQFNIPLSGTGALTKIGTGSWSLTGSNTYSGVAAVNAGTLQLGSSNALLGGGAISFGGGTLQFSSANTVDYSGVIVNSGSAIAIDTNGQNVTFATSLASSNSGGLTKIGAGTLSLTGSHVYTGPTTISAGTLQFGDGTTNGSIVAGSGIADNATLAFNVVGNQSCGNVISGTGVLTKSGAGTLTMTGSNAYTGATTISSGTLQIGDGTTDGSIASSSGITNSGALVFNVAGSQSYGHVIGGTGTLNKSGSGSLIFTATSTYTGATTINSGTLQLGDGTSGHDGSLANTVSIVNNGSLVYNPSGTVSYSGGISGLGSLTKSGSGTVQMYGWSTYSGPTTINSGVLEFGFTEGLNGTSAVTLANVAGAALANNFNNWGEEMVIGSLAGGGALGGNVILNGHSLTVGSDNTSTTFAGVITQGSWGYGSLVKVGTGTLTLTGSETYAGNTTISGGVLDLTGQIRSTFGVITVGSGATLRLHNWTGLATSGWFSGNDSPANSTLVIDGGTIDMAATAGAYNNGRGFTIGAGGATLLVSQPGTSWEVSSSPVFWQGAFGPVTDNSTLTLSGAGNGQLDIPLIGAGSLTKSGSGTWTLTGSNSYSGATTVSAGTLKLANVNALGAGDLTANGGTLDLNGKSVAVGALSGSGGTITSMVSGTSTLTTTVASGTATFVGNVTNGAGSVALAKSGAGTLVLSGSSSYGGGTTVNGGTLNLNSDQALGATTGPVAIHDGATLETSASFLFNASRNVNLSGSATIDTQANTNTIGGLVSGSSATLVKQGSGTLILSGSLTMAGLNANNGVTQLAQSGSIGAVNIAAGAMVTMAAHSGSSYNVLDVSSLTISGSTSALAVDSSAVALHADGLAAGNDYAQLGAYGIANDGAAPASPEAVPEPGTWSLLLSGLGLLIGRRLPRRRTIK